MSDRWNIEHGDCREVLRGINGNQVDACVTDPPYELGFMGKKWDSSGVTFQVETWAEILRVLKPGAHLLAFGGTRTYHRMTCAIEDAGFEIRDSLHWMYGTGFPKSMNIGDGRGTALKPGHEPVVLARKPIVGTVAANVAAHGTGTLNIDGCRIEGSSENARKNKGTGLGYHGANAERGAWTGAEGRWPANVILDEESAAELDAQSGISKSPSTYQRSTVVENKIHGVSNERPMQYGHGDTGGASHFFYIAKVSKRERNTGCAAGNDHPTVKPVSLMRHLVRLVTPTGGIVLDPFCGSGTTGVAALTEGLRFIGIEQSTEYSEIARQRLMHAEKEAA